MAKKYSDTYTEKNAYYIGGYTEIVFSDVYKQGTTNKRDGLVQVGSATIDKVIYNADTYNIIYVSCHADDTDVYDAENIAYFNRFLISAEEYIEKLQEVID